MSLIPSDRVNCENCNLKRIDSLPGEVIDQVLALLKLLLELEYNEQADVLAG